MRDLHQLSQGNRVENGASCLANTIRPSLRRRLDVTPFQPIRSKNDKCLSRQPSDSSPNLFVSTYFILFVEEPEFTDVIQNVTVPAGRSVRLACSVKNLGSYKETELNEVRHLGDDYFSRYRMTPVTDKQGELTTGSLP
ncbi:unnamed protein product [Euphydryas editha]|uniref:Uncharacterized protein n=1 Tax=Euphydryas editha TaxID=104508 RepID=A0AAU9UT76_EUPED|nr:unnamed protein product [Euphydryas editha]